MKDLLTISEMSWLIYEMTGSFDKYYELENLSFEGNYQRGTAERRRLLNKHFHLFMNLPAGYTYENYMLGLKMGKIKRKMKK